MSYRVIALVLLLVSAVAAAVALSVVPEHAQEERSWTTGVDLDKWRKLSLTEYHTTWPTGMVPLLIKPPNSMGRSFQIGITVNGVSPCSGSGVCRF